MLAQPQTSVEMQRHAKYESILDIATKITLFA
jgi:hypothetical protein